MRTFKVLIVLLAVVLLVSSGSAATRYSVATGNWNSTATWAATDQGAPGQSVPVAGDNVFITRGWTVTVSAAAACATLNLGKIGGANAGAGTLVFNASQTLTVSGLLTLGGTSTTASPGTITMTSGGALSVGSLAVNTAAGNTWTPGTGTVVLTATNTLPATIFTSFNNLTINGGTATTLGANIAVTGTLTLTSGDVTLGGFNLTAATVSGGSATSYVATTGAGGLVRTVGASDVSFPIGTATTYNPAILNNAGTSDNYTVRVSTTFTHPAPTPATCVLRDWYVSEGVGGGSNLTVTLQWGAADEGASFVRAGSISTGLFATGGVQWNEGVAILGGANPYTAVAGGFTSVGEFTVGNVGALPIQLASFNAVAAGSNTVNLAWSTISETNNYGFEVQKSQTSDSYQSIAGSFQKGAGTTIDPKSYSFVDASATPGIWYYRLKQIDIDGTSHYSDAKKLDIASSTTGVATTKEKPTVYSLAQNYPNPFNPSTMIHFGIPTGGLVTLKVYNLLGQEVATLVNEQRAAGFHDVVFDGKNLSSGMYVYRLTAGEFSSVKTLVLVK